MRIVLIGPPAAGKTRIGKRLARDLGVKFTDTDVLIVAENGPIPQIFAEHGEAYFRALERQQVMKALEGDGIIAFGGGAVMNPATQADLESASDTRVVLLDVHADVVRQRLSNGKRPLVTSIESWQALVDSRRETYERLADFMIDTSRRPTREVAGEIADWARIRPSEENK